MEKNSEHAGQILLFIGKETNAHKTTWDHGAQGHRLYHTEDSDFCLLHPTAQPCPPIITKLLETANGFDSKGIIMVFNKAVLRSTESCLWFH